MWDTHHMVVFKTNRKILDKMLLRVQFDDNEWYHVGGSTIRMYPSKNLWHWNWHLSASNARIYTTETFGGLHKYQQIRSLPFWRHTLFHTTNHFTKQLVLVKFEDWSHVDLIIILISIEVFGESWYTRKFIKSQREGVRGSYRKLVGDRES